jgi:hypothetical protein
MKKLSGILALAAVIVGCAVALAAGDIPGDWFFANKGNKTLCLASTASVRFASTADTSGSGTFDTGLSRNAAGIVSLDGSTKGDGLGAIIAATIGIDSSHQTAIGSLGASFPLNVPSGVGAVPEFVGPPDQTFWIQGGAAKGISLTAAPNTAGSWGDAKISGGDGTTAGSGASITVGTASGGTRDHGGAITILPGNGTSSKGTVNIKDATGSNVLVVGSTDTSLTGVPSSVSNGSTLEITAGSTSATSGTGGGVLTMSGGASSSASAGGSPNGGAAAVVGGASGTASAATGGAASLTGGVSNGSSGTAGASTVAGGAGGVSGAAGGSATLIGGDGSGAGAGGSALIRPGVSASGTDGTVIIQGVSAHSRTNLITVTGMTAAVASGGLLDVSAADGLVKLPADHATGSTTPLLGTTCPAASGTVHWKAFKDSDGSTIYIATWK